MSFKLKRSSIDLDVFEVHEGGSIVQEIPIRFPLKKIPSSFESLEALNHWLQETERKMASQSAYGSLARRNHSSHGLMRKLESKGFSPTVCSKIVDELKNLGMLKDEEFIVSLIERELRSGHGPRYIEAKLRSQGLSSDQVRKVATLEKQLEVAIRMIKKIKKNPAASLQRRGFDFEIINQALRFS